MRNPIVLLFFIACCIIAVYIIESSKSKEATYKYIDLPEEIQIAQKGDLLQVYRVTKDSVFIGYNGLHVHKDGQVYDHKDTITIKTK